MPDSETKGSSRSSSQPAFYAKSILLILLPITLLLGFGVHKARLAAGESACSGHIYKIAKALREYRYDHGVYPAPVSREGDGPPHSWRVRILPYLMGTGHRQYDFQQTWDSPDNLKVMDEMQDFFTCPNCRNGYCHYFMLNDADTSVLAVENNHQKIYWTEPKDVSREQLDAEACDPSGAAIALKSGSYVRGRISFIQFDDWLRGRTD